MPAFNLEHERSRLAEVGISYGAKIDSARDSIRTLIAERTEKPSHFQLTVAEDSVTGVGYEHRGDLNNSFKKSEEAAPNEKIAARYALETAGYNEAKKKFFQLPPYSTVLLMSPSPDAPIPGYPGHGMAYFYHIMPGENENTRTIKAVSWIHRFGKDEQADILNNSEVGKGALATEQSILLSPVSHTVDGTAGTESFRFLWDKVSEAFHKKKDRDFFLPSARLMEQHMLNGEERMKENFPDLYAMMDNLAARLSRGATKDDIAEDFDILQNFADEQLVFGKQSSSERRKQPLEVLLQQSIPYNIRRHGRLLDIFNQYRHLNYGVRPVDTLCGLSGGIRDVGPVSLFGSPLQQTGNKQILGFSFTAIQEFKSPDKKLKCTCPFCNKKIDAIIADGKITCPKNDGGCGKSAPYNC